MPKLTITLTTKTVRRLRNKVSTTNGNEGTAYTLVQWITLHLKELAISDDLTATVTLLQQQKEQEANDNLEAAIHAARDELIAALM